MASDTERMRSYKLPSDPHPLSFPSLRLAHYVNIADLVHMHKLLL